VSDPGQNGTIFCTYGDQAQIIWTSAAVLPPVNMTYNASVVGVLKPIGGFGLAGPSDTGVYMSIAQAESFFNTGVADLIIVKLFDDSNATTTSVSNAIKSLFGDQVSVVSPTAVLNILGNVFSVIQLFLAGIAAISLLVAGIGIMNIMIVSLMERTREIGILKALGMRNRTVLSVFLSESIIIGLLGAVVGIVSGWILANIVALVFQGGGLINAGTAQMEGTAAHIAITPVLTPTVVMLALGFGVGVSAIFALYPAWRASRLKPVEALRYE
jgi:putative ABC transport system permease protein